MKKEEKKYYVYVYLDPRQSKGYKYEFKGGFYNPKYLPVYIGAGSGNRWKRHFWENGIYLLVEKIEEIRKSGREPKIRILKRNLTRRQSFELEKRLIIGIGRRDLNTGSLVNQTDGGQGGKNPSEKRRKEIIKNSKKIWENQEYKKKMSEKSKKMWKNPEYKEGMKKILEEKWKDPKYKKNMSEKSKEVWKNPEYRKKISKRMKEGWEKSEKKEQVSNRAKERNLKNWKDPEYREKMIKASTKRSGLIEEDVLTIRKLHQKGTGTYEELSGVFNVSIGTIARIIHREIWAHI